LYILNEKIPFLLNYIYTMGVSKENIGFSLDKEVSKELKKFCEENSINRSHLVNKLIKNHLKESRKIIKVYVETNNMDN